MKRHEIQNQFICALQKYVEKFLKVSFRVNKIDRIQENFTKYLFINMFGFKEASQGFPILQAKE